MASHIISIPLSETEHFSKLMLNYISADIPLKEFYNYQPSLEGFEQILKNNNFDACNRELLVEVLKEQYQNAGIDSTSLKIDVLLNKNTYTVCTGHQLCLFTGPLYFIYKIISTINLAEALQKQFPEYSFVPVYWMATEDHDFEEIKSIHLFGKNVSWENNYSTGAVGRLNTNSLTEVINELKQILGESQHANELIALFSDAYLKHNNIADATRYLVHRLFGNYNLLIVDGNNKKLKAEFTAILEDDLIQHTNNKVVLGSITKLESIGYKAQVNPREINCFYMKDNVRERIEFNEQANLYCVLNTSITFTKEQLLIDLKAHPEHYSPNVVLRPVFQQMVLPNLAYVGGPGELAYWLEFKAMFDFHQVTYPILMPRNFALLMDEKSMQQFNKLGFETIAIFNNTDALLKAFVINNVDKEFFLNEETEKIAITFNEISEKANLADATLKAGVEAELQKTIKAIKVIEAKMLKAEKQKQETGIQQLKKIKSKFFPEGILQERYDNFAPYYLKHGTNFIAELKQQFNPFDFRLLILEF
jgi:bacillithiol biosynthesis cysteine-adding enzyme BshC